MFFTVRSADNKGDVTINTALISHFYAGHPVVRDGEERRTTVLFVNGHQLMVLCDPSELQRLPM